MIVIISQISLREHCDQINSEVNDLYEYCDSPENVLKFEVSDISSDDKLSDFEALFYLETIEEGDEDEKDYLTFNMEMIKQRKIPIIAITPDKNDTLTKADVQNIFLDDMAHTDTEDIFEEDLSAVTTVTDDDTDIEEFEGAKDETSDRDCYDSARADLFQDSLDYCGIYDESFRVKDGSSKRINLIKSHSVSEYVDQEGEYVKQLTDYEDIIGSDIDNDIIAYEEDEKILIKLLDDHNHVIDISDKLQKSDSPAATTPQLTPKWSPTRCFDKKLSQTKTNTLYITSSASNYGYITESELLMSDSEAFKKDDRRRKKLHKLKGDKRHQRKSKSLELGALPSFCNNVALHGDSSTEDDVTHKEVSSCTHSLHPETPEVTKHSYQEELFLTANEREPIKRKLEDHLTDIELFETENDGYIRPKSPEPSDEESGLPEPTRLMTLVKEESSGKIVDLNFPLGDALPDGLYNPVKDTLSDIELFEVDNNMIEDTFTERCPTPVLNLIEGGIIESCERSIILSPIKKRCDFKLDITDLDSPKAEKQRKIKSKPKSVAEINIELSSLNILTDTEELNLSDLETPRRLSHPIITRGNDDNPLTDIDDVDLSDEDEEGFRRTRSFSLTPDFINEFTGDTFTTSKENGCPFSCEQKRQILSLNIPHSRGVGTPDIPGTQQTDTEDIADSADETFLEAGHEIRVVEDDSFESSVHIGQSTKMDFQSSEEIIHMKDGGLRETHTDIEEVEEDEIRLIHDLRILDTKSKFCVCANTNETVCICFEKPLNELTIEWEDEKGSASEKGTKKSIILKTTCSLNHSKQQSSKVISFRVDSSSHSFTAQQISSKNQVVMSLFYSPRHEPYLKIPYVDFYLQIKSSSVRTEMKINLLRNVLFFTNISYFHIHIPQQLQVKGVIIEENKSLKYFRRNRPNYLTVRSLSEDLVFPGNITFYKDTTINVSELVSKFEVFSEDCEHKSSTIYDKSKIITDSAVIRKPLVNIASLKDRSTSPERLKPSSIKNSPAFKVFREVKQSKIEVNAKKIEILRGITEKISIFEKLAGTSNRNLKTSPPCLRRALSFPSRKKYIPGKMNRNFGGGCKSHDNVLTMHSNKSQNSKEVRIDKYHNECFGQLTCLKLIVYLLNHFFTIISCFFLL